MEETANEVEVDWIAKLENHTPDAEWKQSVEEGSMLDAGTYQLLTGEVLLRFSSDVELVVKAPASFDIKSNMEVVLHEGVVRAKVAEKGHGFIVDTPKTKVRDLGTEFGVSVREDEQTEVHVFNGEIELLGANNEAEELAKEGFAARWSKERRVSIPVALEGAFPTESLIRYKKRIAYQQKLLSDPSLLAYYDFSEVDDPSVLVNKSSNTSIGNGVIQSPTWVRGRWSGQKAILFDSASDSIDVELPEMKGSFTLQTWVKPDRFDHSLQVILDSDQWKDGCHHWQITNTGALRVGVGGNKGFAITSQNGDVKLGEWVQLTVTFDQSSRVLSYYVNERKVAEHQSQTEVINLGKSQIGCWRVNGQSTRGFRGRMDEFSLRARCLSSEEIKESYLAGKNL